MITGQSVGSIRTLLPTQQPVGFDQIDQQKKGAHAMQAVSPGPTSGRGLAGSILVPGS